jgi:hypothetical protein
VPPDNTHFSGDPAPGKGVDGRDRVVTRGTPRLFAWNFLQSTMPIPFYFSCKHNRRETCDDRALRLVFPYGKMQAQKTQWKGFSSCWQKIKTTVQFARPPAKRPCYDVLEVMEMEDGFQRSGGDRKRMKQ